MFCKEINHRAFLLDIDSLLASGGLTKLVQLSAISFRDPYHKFLPRNKKYTKRPEIILYNFQ